MKQFDTPHIKTAPIKLTFLNNGSMFMASTELMKYENSKFDVKESCRKRYIIWNNFFVDFNKPMIK